MDTFILPNGAKIDIDSCTDVVLLQGEFPKHFLDTETGNVCIIESPDALKKSIGEIDENNRYREIARFSDKEYSEIITDFLETILDGCIPNKIYQELQSDAEKKGWREVLAKLYVYENDWRHAWDQFVHDEASGLAEEWVMNIPGVPVVASFVGCEDCALCELMRTGEDRDPAKLHKAFEIENTMQMFAQTVSGDSEASTNQEDFRKKVLAKNNKKTLSKPQVLRSKGKSPKQNS